MLRDGLTMMTVNGYRVLTMKEEVFAEELASFKVVRVNGQWRFLKVVMFENHPNMLFEGETATAACTIDVRPGEFRYQSLQSQLLKVGMSEEDDLSLEEFFGCQARMG